MASLIPFTPSKPYQSFDVVLGDFTVTIDAHWNVREEAWYFDVLDDTGKEILKGTKIVLGVNLCGRSTHPVFQQNVLRALDTSNEGREATFDDLNVRVIVLHRTIQEFLGLNGQDIDQ